MPVVPQSMIRPPSSTLDSPPGSSPLESPSPENLLMAAAEMKKMGRLGSQDTMPKPKPITPSPRRGHK